MKNIIFLICLVGLSFSCKKEDKPNAWPKCFDYKIQAILSEDVWDPPAKIYSYQYDGETVYYIPARCCDIPSLLYDEDCSHICSPSGGIAGGGDGQCTDFFDRRTDEKLLWEDYRK